MKTNKGLLLICPVCGKKTWDLKIPESTTQPLKEECTCGITATEYCPKHYGRSLPKAPKKTDNK